MNESNLCFGDDITKNYMKKIKNNSSISSISTKQKIVKERKDPVDRADLTNDNISACNIF